MKQYEKWYTLTQYPEIYEQVFWGCSYNFNNAMHIIDNRNRFMVDYNIQDVISVYALPTDIRIREHFQDRTERLKRFEHLEVYRTVDNGILCICSPYESIEEENIELLVLGWKKIYPLYDDGANTYMKWIV